MVATSFAFVFLSAPNPLLDFVHLDLFVSQYSATLLHLVFGATVKKSAFEILIFFYFKLICF
jgi:hypothetical protein